MNILSIAFVLQEIIAATTKKHNGWSSQQKSETIMHLEASHMVSEGETKTIWDIPEEREREQNTEV